MSKVSIIIPVYNAGKYLKKCLDSAVGQDFEDFDIICVDDCSTDDSPAILAEYEDQYSNVRVIRNTCNNGVAFCRNRAVEQADSEYILFLDSDDWLEKDTLKITYDCALRNSLDMVIFQMRLLYEDQELEKFYEAYSKRSKYLVGPIKSGKQMLIDTNGWIDMICTAKLLSLNMIRESNIRFTEGFVHEDNAYSLKIMLSAKRAKVIDDELYIYLRRESSITTLANQEKRLKGSIAAYADMLRLLTSKYYDDQEISPVLSHILDRKFNTVLSDFPDINSFGDLKFDNPYYQHIYHLFRQSQGLFSGEEIESFKKYEHIIIYGAGRLGKRVLRDLKGLRVDGFAVSETRGNKKEVENLPVKSIDDYMSYRKNSLVIIAIMSDEKNRIKSNLREHGFENVWCM
ncbi:Glycosyl transferase family 2 [Lachnospiraceae bacterium]|nr:Glycosyl transferase family 2 [Lachnospiraceae bacterium]